MRVINKRRAGYKTRPPEPEPPPIDRKDPQAVLNRPFTRLTPYIIQKWYAEGESIELIAKTLKRSPDNVRLALKVPLTAEEQLELRKRLCPKKPVPPLLLPDDEED